MFTFDEDVLMQHGTVTETIPKNYKGTHYEVTAVYNADFDDGGNLIRKRFFVSCHSVVAGTKFEADSLDKLDALIQSHIDTLS